jgi:hypothetical protein
LNERLNFIQKLLKIKFKFFPTKFTDCKLITACKEVQSFGNYLEKEYQYRFRNTSERQTGIPQNGRQRARFVEVIMITMIITTLNTMAGNSNSLRAQATSKLTSPSAVQFVQ